MNGILDSQSPALATDSRLMIGNNRVGYAVPAGFSLAGAFVLSAVVGAGGGALALLLLGVAVAYGLFNVAGTLRPKRLLLSPEGMLYRPVVGRERFVPWNDMKSIDHVVIDRGFGTLKYQDPEGRSHRLGLWLEISAVAQEVERWRDLHS